MARRYRSRNGVVAIFVSATLGGHLTSAFSPGETGIPTLRSTTPASSSRLTVLSPPPHDNANMDVSTSTSTSNPSMPNLRLTDPELSSLIDSEDARQRDGLELIASENFCSPSVREALGSCLTNKYSEGTVGKRYYGGNEYIDKIEAVCMDRALSLYGLEEGEWGVNVQPYSGSPANFAVYTALLNPHDRIMGLDLPAGGHLTHGFQTQKRKVSATSVYFESLPYTVDPATGYVDYDDMQHRATLFMPKLLIAGGSAYSREWDYARMRTIADSVGAYLMVDMAHTSGLVAAKLLDPPFPYADVVTTTTHKTLRGPRSGMIFSRRPLAKRVDEAVFPALQGGPHNHQIAAVAVALGEAADPSFVAYQKSVVENADVLAEELVGRGHTLTTGGTDNHLLLWDVRPHGLTGSKVEKVLEAVGVTTNKNSVPGDTSAVNPGGVRVGTPALTTRGFGVEDFRTVAEFLDRGCRLAMDAQEVARGRNGGGGEGKVLLKDFLRTLGDDEDLQRRVVEMRNEVEAFASAFPMV